MAKDKPDLKVTFGIELRPRTPEQVEAGKRLFARLLDKAQRDGKAANTDQARSAPGGKRSCRRAVPRPPAPHSLSGGQILHDVKSKSNLEEL